MITVLVIIVVAGVVLPVALLLTARRVKALPVRNPAGDEIGRWLISEYDLGAADCTLVRRAVLVRPGEDRSRLEPGSSASSAAESLTPSLREPASALAERVLADGFRMQRVSRRLGWLQLGSAVAYAAYGIAVLALGLGVARILGALALVNVAAIGSLGYNQAVLVPRRTRERARQVLRLLAPAGLREDQVRPDAPGLP